jgi:hypothetical protein
MNDLLPPLTICFRFANFKTVLERFGILSKGGEGNPGRKKAVREKGSRPRFKTVRFGAKMDMHDFELYNYY